MKKSHLLAIPVLLALVLSVPRPASPATARAEERIGAIDGLAAPGGEAAARDLLPFLADPDLAVRTHAMRRLAEIGEPAVGPLVAALSDENVRWLASGALINIGSPAIRKTVVALKDRNPSVRRNALFILRQLEAKAAAPSIQSALDDPDPMVQVQAVQTVAQFGGEGALRLVLGKAESRVTEVREAAIGCLPRFGEASLPALSSLMDYGRPDAIRVSAMRAIGEMGTRDALALLLKGLDDPSPLVRFYACTSLAATEEPAVLEAMARHLDDPSPLVREAAVEGIARMPDAAKPLIARYLREGNELQKIGAAGAARSARFRPAVPDLLDALRDRSRDVKISAVASLMTIQDPASVEGLVNALRDPDIRWLCVIALRQFGDKNLRPLLRRTGDPEIDSWRQYVLEGMGDRVLEGCLEALKREEDVGTRIATLCTMRQIKDTRAVYPVLGLLQDEKLGFVAAFVLAQMGDPAIEPLLLSLQDESPAVRARAATALGEIGLARVVGPLRSLGEDPDPVVRHAAERALRRISRDETRPCPPGGPCP